MNVISLNNVKKYYNNFTLDIKQLDIKSGFITGFIGQNGAGKSTTMKIIMDALAADEGEVEVFGTKVDKDFAPYKNQIGFVGEKSGYVDLCTPAQIKKMIAPFYTSWDENLYKSYIKRFDIQENKKLSQLSKGQNKIFNLIIALSHHPKLIILDEPTSNLDPVVRNNLLEILSELMLDETVTVLYSTHITSDLEKTCDYIVYIQNGKIVMNCEREIIEENYCIVKGDSSLLTEDVIPMLTSIQKTSAGFNALCSNRARIVSTLGSRVVIEKALLDDIMIYFAKESA